MKKYDEDGASHEVTPIAAQHTVHFSIKATPNDNLAQTSRIMSKFKHFKIIAFQWHAGSLEG